jgi:hypothetical protein
MWKRHKQKQKRTYDLREEKQMFISFIMGHGEVEDVKKKKVFDASWEGPYLFVRYVDENVTTLALGSQPRQRRKVAGQEGSPRVTSHVPGSARECEGINPHTPNRTPTLGS